MEDITVHVKQGSQLHNVTIPAESLAFALQERLQAITGVLARKQKLIFKGKVLDPGAKLASQSVGNGSKVMLLLASDSVQTKGQQAAQAVNKQKQEEAKQRLEAAFASARGHHVPSTSQNVTAAPNCSGITWDDRKRNWQKTGIVAIRDLGLSELPSLALAGLQECKHADISLNHLVSLPHSLFQLTSLQTIKLNNNKLTDDGVCWHGLCGLTNLSSLILDDNIISSVPSSISRLCCLRQLSIARNQVQNIAEEVGSLVKLESLLLDNNEVQELPVSLGGCSELVELSACSNQIQLLPDSLGQLTKLQSIRLDENRVSKVPAAVLQGCSVLWQLALHNNPITVEHLRETPGFKTFDERRRAKCDKQMDGRVMFDISRSFTEGADQQQWSHWGNSK